MKLLTLALYEDLQTVPPWPWYISDEYHASFGGSWAWPTAAVYDCCTSQVAQTHHVGYWHGSGSEQTPKEVAWNINI